MKPYQRAFIHRNVHNRTSCSKSYFTHCSDIHHKIISRFDYRSYSYIYYDVWGSIIKYSNSISDKMY
jgi:hypothetical protein